MAMSTDPDSRISTPVSLTATPSMLSELDRLRDGKHDGGGLPQDPPNDFKMPGAASPYLSEPPPMPSISDSPTVIDLGDGDMELKVNNTVFKTHKHLLNDFSRLKEIIKGMERCNAFGSNGVPCVAVYRDEHGVDDFRNMFKILYASLIKGPFEFDPPILVSALRIATAYDYPELRKFSIDRLEKLTLSAIQRIELAREFDLTAWKETAYKELCSREEAITKEEARALGADMMEEIAKAREEEKQKKAKEIGVQEEKARREAEEQAKREAEEKAKREEEERLKREEEERLKREEEERLKREEEERLKREAEEKAKQEEQAKKEAEEKAKQEAEAKK